MIVPDDNLKPHELKKVNRTSSQHAEGLIKEHNTTSGV